jgi:hypothetical protein
MTGRLPRLRRLLIVIGVAAASVAANALASATPLTVAPTAAQRAAILRAFGDPPAADGCLAVRLAAANHRYGTVRFRRQHRCRRWAFNGVNLLERVRAGRWRVVFEGSAFRCPLPRIPRQVQFDLGVCPLGHLAQ